MIAQLSTSSPQRQPIPGFWRKLSLSLLLVFLSNAMPVMAQASKIERLIEPLSPVDRQFMAAQRATIESLANRLGRRLTSDPDRDIDTLQEILDRGMIATDDTLTLQAAGIVLGDLLAGTLDMDWVVYRDRAGRSRALRYRNEDIYLYPVTMVSRRWEVGNERPVAVIYAQAISETRTRLPGARWR